MTMLLTVTIVIFFKCLFNIKVLAQPVEYHTPAGSDSDFRMDSRAEVIRLQILWTRALLLASQAHMVIVFGAKPYQVLQVLTDSSSLRSLGSTAGLICSLFLFNSVGGLSITPGK